MKQLLIISFIISLALGISSVFILKPQRVKCEIVDIQAEQTAYRGSHEYTVQSYTASSGLCDVDDYKGWLEVDKESYHIIKPDPNKDLCIKAHPIVGVVDD